MAFVQAIAPRILDATTADLNSKMIKAEFLMNHGIIDRNDYFQLVYHVDFDHYNDE